MTKCALFVTQRKFIKNTTTRQAAAEVIPERCKKGANLLIRKQIQRLILNNREKASDITAQSSSREPQSKVDMCTPPHHKQLLKTGNSEKCNYKDTTMLLWHNAQEVDYSFI